MKNQLDSQLATRHQLISCITILVLVMIPHYFNIHSNIIVSFMILAGIKLASIRIVPALVNRWVILLFSVICFSISAWHYGVPLGRDPGVSFLIILLGLKLLESKTRRDLRIILFLGFFAVITHFLYFPAFPLVTFLFLIVLAITWMLIQISHVDPQRYRFADIKLMLRITLQAIPFALILFFLFPRFAGSLWLLQSPSSTSTTGMSSEMSMGSVSNLVESDEIAFTATFTGKPPPGWARYWRAGVLWQTDGKTWREGPSIRDDYRKLIARGDFYQYDINLENSNNKWLFALDAVNTKPDNIKITSEGYLKRHINKKRFARYQVNSALTYQDFTITPEIEKLGLELDPNLITPRMRDLINEQINKAGNHNNLADNLARQFLHYFNHNPFSYTLRPATLFSDNPVDEFLFQSREGFCEHYAASFVTLMRGANIPARVVVGYLGGEFNPRANQITVRQADAHAWAEYWSETNGWTRVDPTAAIAPDRINRSINLAASLNQNGRVSFNIGDPGWIKTLIREARWYSSLAKVQWNRWFVGYDHIRQKKLLTYFGLGSIDITHLIGFAFLLAVGVLTVIALVFFIHEKNIESPEKQLYKEFCALLDSVGVGKSSYEGSISFNQRLIKVINQYSGDIDLVQRNNLIADVTKINQLYSNIQYGTQANIESVDQLRTRIKQLKKQLKDFNFHATESAI